MGTLSKKLRFKKPDGTQGTVDIYDSLADCPYPNLKVKVGGVQGYVKLGTANDGEIVPIKVKTNTAGVLNVIKTTVPTGSITLQVQGKARNTPLANINYIDVVIPAGVKIIKIAAANNKSVMYLGVTPNKTYRIAACYYYTKKPYLGAPWYISGSYICRNTGSEVTTLATVADASVSSWTISWSPEINNQAPNKTDYITD